MRSLRKVLVGALLVTASGTLLHAQPAPAPAPAPTPGPATPGVAGEVSAEATAPSAQQAQISPTEMQAQVSALSTQNNAHLRHVEQLRMTARKQKDVIKLNCVNDKHLQMKALVNIVEGAASNLEVAVLGNDDEARYHEFTKVTISSERVRALRDEADACVGEELTYLGDTVVEVNRPEIPDDPTDDDPFDDVIEPPGYASPFD